MYFGGGSSVGALEGERLLLVRAVAAAVSRIVSSMCSPIGGRYSNWILYKIICV